MDVSAPPATVAVNDVTCLSFGAAKAELQGQGLQATLGGTAPVLPQCPNPGRVALQDPGRRHRRRREQHRDRLYGRALVAADRADRAVGADGMTLRYAAETFTSRSERSSAPHFSNLDGPVFALTNLPEAVKGAMFARYSRTKKSLRRLFLDEFAEESARGRAATSHRRGARRAALREGLRGVRRRLGRPAGRGAPGVRAGVAAARQGAGVGTARRLSGAVDAVHAVRRPSRRRVARTLPRRDRRHTPRTAVRDVS